MDHAVEPPGFDDEGDAPGDLARLEVNPFLARLVVGRGSSRADFGRSPETRGPGIYGLLNGCSVHIGMGSDAGLRVANGAQPIRDIAAIFVITDANGNLTDEDAGVAERILWSRVAAFGDREPVNGLPNGGPIDPVRYGQIDQFVAFRLPCPSERGPAVHARNSP